MTDARINFSFHLVSVRHRVSHEAPLSKSQVIKLGTLDRDRQVEVVRYRAPTLIVDVKDVGGDTVSAVKVGTIYT